MRRVELHVDTIVLTGFPAEAQHSIVAGLRAALVETLTTAGPEALSSAASTRGFDAGSVPVHPTMTAHALGAAAGAAVARALR